MSWLVVTPARNEATRLPELAASLRAQSAQPVGLWVIVDDGSSDATATCVDATSVPFPVTVLSLPASPGIKNGGAFSAFLRGALAGLAELPAADRVMKLDADIVLAVDYFQVLLESLGGGDVGLIGGVIDGWREREQRHHVRGALKSYNRAAFELVRRLEPALGFDAVDEVAIRAAGLPVLRVDGAMATTTRRTGVSTGLMAGRVRGGIVARWSGYHPLYFACRLVRYLGRRPFLLGAAAMLWGYLEAGPGPFPVEIRRHHRAEQLHRLIELSRRPVVGLRDLYGVDA